VGNSVRCVFGIDRLLLSRFFAPVNDYIVFGFPSEVKSGIEKDTCSNRLFRENQTSPIRFTLENNDN
jgi:hypothetical protein